MKRSFAILAACALMPAVQFAFASGEGVVYESPAQFATNAPVISKEATALETVEICRGMIPDGIVKMRGEIRLRNRRGFNLAKYSFKLTMERKADVSRLEAVIAPENGGAPLQSVEIVRDPQNGVKVLAKDAAGNVSTPPLNGLVMGTDVTWLDLTLDFLWWKNAAYDGDVEEETVHAQPCRVIKIAPDEPIGGLSAAKVWIDRKTGCLLQAEQLDEDVNPVRRLWGTRIKKFGGERWMASVLEVETLGSGHRTKITIDDLEVKTPGPQPAGAK